MYLLANFSNFFQLLDMASNLPNRTAITWSNTFLPGTGYHFTISHDHVEQFASIGVIGVIPQLDSQPWNSSW
jgi:hypothetical protein